MGFIKILGKKNLDEFISDLSFIFLKEFYSEKVRLR